MNTSELRRLIKEIVDAEMDVDTPEGAEAMRQNYLQGLIEKMDQFTKSYIETALWSSTDSFTYQHGPPKDQFDTEYDEEEPSGEEEMGGEQLDKKYTIDDFELGTLERMVKDCKSFYDKYSELYHKAGWADNRAAHDFWLTRNGHGAGFWSREIDELDPELYGNMTDDQFEEVKEVLTKAAKSYGEYNLYIGDGAYDGLVCGG